MMPMIKGRETGVSPLQKSALSQKEAALESVQKQAPEKSDCEHSTEASWAAAKFEMSEEIYSDWVEWRDSHWQCRAYKGDGKKCLRQSRALKSPDRYHPECSPFCGDHTDPNNRGGPSCGIKLPPKKQRKRKTISGRVRYKLLQAAGFRCQAWGARASDTTLVIDHAIPFSKGGADDESNYQVLYEACNHSKGDLIYGEVVS